MRLLKPKTAIAACALVLSFVAQVVTETWDMPTAYSGLNYQTQTPKPFRNVLPRGRATPLPLRFIRAGLCSKERISNALFKLDKFKLGKGSYPLK